MDAIIRPKEKAEELDEYQRDTIVRLALRQESYPLRTERLKKMNFCTDAVKFEVLKQSPRISDELYDCLYNLYFGVVEEEQKETEQPEGILSEPGWQVVEPKEKRTYVKWDEADIMTLIHYYKKGTSIAELAKMFNKNKHQINDKIRLLKKNEKYRGMFNMNNEEAAKQEQKFEKIIQSVDAGKLSEMPVLNDMPKAFKAKGKGFLSTESGLKLDEEPITALLRQKMVEKGLAQFYAEVTIIVKPVMPAGMVVEVEE